VGPARHRLTNRLRRPGRPGPVALLALALLLALAAACRAEPPLPTYASLPAFTLTDQAGRPFGSADLGGRVAVINFIYTTCADSCPLLSANMRQVQQSLKADGLLASRAMLLSLSIDPERDRPEVLRAYGERFGAELEGWKLLTGSAEVIGEVGQGLKLGRAIPLPPSPTQPVVNLAHSNRFVLVDGNGQVRGYYSGEDLVVEDLIRDLKRLVQ
jgi:protein SCO1/2